MKPGPATSAAIDIGSRASRARSSSASARGALRAAFASTIAALVEMSPCAGSRGGSTAMRSASRPAAARPRISASISPAITAMEMREEIHHGVA